MLQNTKRLIKCKSCGKSHLWCPEETFRGEKPRKCSECANKA